MKRSRLYAGVFVAFFVTISVTALASSRANKADCERWCNANKPRCVKCDSNVFCDGRTLDVIKSFKKGTGNWYACGLSEYAAESLKNKNECLAWCRRDPRCESCKTTVGCGSGYADLKMFGGRGNNWYACGDRDRLSQLTKQQCLAWCQRDERCESCKTTVGCGPGYADLKMFSGEGENWYACGNRERLSQLTKQECENWCEEERTRHNHPCLKCSSKVGCGSGYRVAKRFRAEGENWYACEFIDSREQCDAYCRAHKPECEFCSGNPGCGVGYTSMKSFDGVDPRGLDANLFLEVAQEIYDAFKKNSYACKKK